MRIGFRNVISVISCFIKPGQVNIELDVHDLPCVLQHLPELFSFRWRCYGCSRLEFSSQCSGGFQATVISAFNGEYHFPMGYFNEKRDEDILSVVDIVCDYYVSLKHSQNVAIFYLFF